MTKKKTNNKSKTDIINSPRVLIITLIVILVLLTFMLFRVSNKYKFYSGELSTKEIAVDEIHYYSSPVATYFFANQAAYLGEAKKVTKLNIGYYVKSNNNLLLIEDITKEFEEPADLGEVITLYSKFKVAGLTNGKGTYLSKDIQKNMKNLYLIINAQTKGASEYDIHIEEPIQLFKVNE